MFCSLMQDEDIEFPQNVERKDKEDGTINFSAETEVLKQLALELSLAGPKLCIAVPYEDASKVFNAPEYQEWLSRFDGEPEVSHD